MKASELRIGNKVCFYKSLVRDLQIGTIAEIFLQPNSSSEYYFKIPEFNPKISLSSEGFAPIPLTEDWLLKFGFYNIGNDKNEGVEFKKRNLFAHDNTHVDYCFRLDQPFFIRFNELSFRLDKSTLIPKYVHELQNLVFYLTGIELITK